MPAPLLNHSRSTTGTDNARCFYAQLLQISFIASAGVSQDACNLLQRAFAPALYWIQRWLPIFYAPGLVTISIALQVRSRSSKL